MRKRTVRRKVARRAKTRRGGAVGNNNDPSYNASSRMYGGPAPSVNMNPPSVSSRMNGGPAPFVNEPNVSSRMYGGPAPIVNAAPNQYADVPNVPNANHPPSYTSSSSNMGAQVNSTTSSNMATQSNRASRSNMGTQTNRKNASIANLMREDARLRALRVAPVAAAAPVDLEPYIQTYVDLYQRITGISPWPAGATKQVGEVFRQRLAEIVQPIIAIYGIGYYRHQGGGAMISYVITNMGIYGITVINTMSGYVVNKPIQMYRFTNELTPAMRSVLESYSREPFFVGDHNNEYSRIIYDFRRKFQSLYMGIPGQQLVDERQISL